MERRTRLTSDPAKARAWRDRSAQPLKTKPRPRLPDPHGARECLGALLLQTRCFGQLHRHHLTRRSQGGPDDPANLVWLCAGHHDWVHANIAEARTFGLLT